MSSLMWNSCDIPTDPEERNKLFCKVLLENSKKQKKFQKKWCDNLKRCCVFVLTGSIAILASVVTVVEFIGIFI